MTDSTYRQLEGRYLEDVAIGREWQQRTGRTARADRFAMSSTRSTLRRGIP
jgi:hypothetical protein